MVKGGAPKKTKLGKTRLDKFYHLAKEQGFRSRASFKLIQLNKKYDLLSKAKVVLDLCAAPGSWAQVCAKTMPINSLIIAVDLVPMKPIPRVITLQEDITTDKCKAAIKSHLKTWKVDLVLNDGAPNVGANWSKDAYSQSELTLLALKLAVQFLAAGGNFVTKVFRSQDYNALLWTLNQLFQRVEATKPTASRNESAEIFVVCIGYLAPKKIDPKLLDPKHIFEELDLNPAKKANVMQLKKETRHRDGYEHGVTLLYKEITATNFVLCEDALDALTVNNKIVFEKTLESDQKIAGDKRTTEEILACCGDLRVLGKREFRQLLRWRDAMKDLIAPKAAPAEESSEEDEEDEEARLGREMEELAKAAVGREKRAKRKEREKKAAYQRRIDMKMDNPDDVLETQEELGLFSMKKSRAAMIDDKDRAMEQADAFAENPYSDESEEEEEEASSEEEFDAEGSTKGPRARRLAQLEAEFDQLYESYCERTGTGSHARVRKKRRGQADGGDEDDLNGFVPDLTAEPGEDTAGPRPSGAGGDEWSAEDDNDEAARAARAERWFSQELFSGVPLDAKSTEAEAEAVPKKQRVAGKGPAAVEGDSIAGRAAEKEGFEEVAVSESDSDSDSESDVDSDGEAEVAAMGQLLLKKKIRKEDLIDACYHKYAFNDVHLAPQWFQDQERQFLKPQLPVTKAMIEEERARNMAIAARPIKKVMEAKARKKIKAVRAQQKLAAKMDGVANDTDISDKAKMRALQKLYDKGVSIKRPRAVTVVASKSKGKAAGKKNVKVVDKRMKKDKDARIRTGNRNFKGGKKGKKSKVTAKVAAQAPRTKIRKRKGQ